MAKDRDPNWHVTRHIRIGTILPVGIPLDMPPALAYQISLFTRRKEAERHSVFLNRDSLTAQPPPA
jgi:hypothetical protein